MKINWHISTWVLTLALLATSVASSSAGSLNEQIISQFAQSWEALTQRLVAVDAEFDPQNLNGIVNQLEHMASADGPHSARDNAVKQDGYTDFETWAKTALLIIKCAQWAKDPIDAADVEKAIASIYAGKDQTVDDKALLIDDINKAYDAAMKQKPDQTDIDIAIRLLPWLEPIVWPKQ